MPDFCGAASFLTNGDRVGITSEGAPIVPSALVQIVNKANSTGLRCSSYWQGSGASPFQNNDNSLWETYNKVIDNSSNLSWSISAPNGYNDIPAGVTDLGERLGVYGWAVSVNIPGAYEHNGTLASQIGVGGRAGFRGDINVSPNTAIIKSAVGVRGDIVGESPLATIENAFGGRFLADDSIVSNVLNATAVYAEAGAGSVSNFSFFGAVGQFYNRDVAFFGPSSTIAGQSGAAISARGIPANALEFGNGDSTGYGSNIGATAPSGLPFVAFNAEADPSGNTFRTRGKKGAVISSNLNGGIAFSRVPDANAANQTLVEMARFDADGALALVKTPIFPIKAPTSATAAGKTGEFCWDANYFYICVAANTWRRVAHATWWGDKALPVIPYSLRQWWWVCSLTAICRMLRRLPRPGLTRFQLHAASGRFLWACASWQAQAIPSLIQALIVDGPLAAPMGWPTILTRLFRGIEDEAGMSRTAAPPSRLS